MFNNLSDTEIYNTYGGGLSYDIGKATGELAGHFVNLCKCVLIFVSASIESASEANNETKGVHGGGGRSF